MLTLAFRPDGVELAVATLDGQILFWDVNRCAVCNCVGKWRQCVLHDAMCVM